MYVSPDVIWQGLPLLVGLIPAFSMISFLVRVFLFGLSFLLPGWLAGNGPSQSRGYQRSRIIDASRFWVPEPSNGDFKLIRLSRSREKDTDRHQPKYLPVDFCSSAPVPRLPPSTKAIVIGGVIARQTAVDRQTSRETEELEHERPRVDVQMCKCA